MPDTDANGNPIPGGADSALDDNKGAGPSPAPSGADSPQRQPPATIPYSRFSEVVNKSKAIEAELGQFKSKAAKLAYLEDLNSALEADPALLEGLKGILSGTHRVSPLSSEDMQDPAIKAVLKQVGLTQKQIAELKQTITAQGEALTVKQQEESVATEVKTLSSKYPFLANDSHKSFVLAAYLTKANNNPDVTLDEVAAEYAEATGQKVPASATTHTPAYFKSKESRMGGGGRAAAVAARPAPKLGDEADKAAQEYLDSIT